MRRRALNSGLIAHDQVTCALQAMIELREPKHDIWYIEALSGMSNYRMRGVSPRIAGDAATPSATSHWGLFAMS